MSTLVVVSHQRTNIGGTNYTMSVYDGSGNVLWRKDFGTTTAGNPSLPGRAVIDSSGNIYVPYGGKDGNVFDPELASNVIAVTYGMRMYDSSGSLQWDTSLGKGKYAANNPTWARILSNGNVAMTHGLLLSNSKLQLFLTVLDSTGSIVDQWGYKDSTWGWSAAAKAAYGSAYSAPFDVDGSDNVYMMFNNTSSVSFNGIVKLDSTGTYQSHTTSLTGSVDSLVYDLTHDKLHLCYYCPNPSVGDYSGTERVHGRMDPGTLTFDYANRIQDIWGVGTFDLVNSALGAVAQFTVTGLDNAMFKTIDMHQGDYHLRIPCGEARDSGPSTITIYLDALQDGSLYNYSTITSTINKSWGQACCVDQTTGDVYVVQAIVQSSPNNYHVFKFASGGLSSTWNVDTDIVKPYAVGARTF